MVPPLAVDIDGTLTGADRVVDPRVLPVLREWKAPVVVATGKALPYPVALCQFAGVPEHVIAENGGVALAGDEIHVHGDGEAARRVLEEYEAAGYDAGWGAVDLLNRWRETEVAVSRDSPLGPLEAVAADYGLEVVDTGFAYHVKDTDVNKGTALESIAPTLDVTPGDFVAVGDSANDVDLFAAAGRSYAVANAAESAKATADVLLEQSYADGFLEAVERILS